MSEYRDFKNLFELLCDAATENASSVELPEEIWEHWSKNPTIEGVKKVEGLLGVPNGIIMEIHNAGSSGNSDAFALAVALRQMQSVRGAARALVEKYRNKKNTNNQDFKNS